MNKGDIVKKLLATKCNVLLLAKTTAGDHSLYEGLKVNFDLLKNFVSPYILDEIKKSHKFNQDSLVTFMFSREFDSDYEYVGDVEYSYNLKGQFFIIKSFDDAISISLFSANDLGGELNAKETIDSIASSLKIKDVIIPLRRLKESDASFITKLKRTSSLNFNFLFYNIDSRNDEAELNKDEISTYIKKAQSLGFSALYSNDFDYKILISLVYKVEDTIPAKIQEYKDSLYSLKDIWEICFMAEEIVLAKDYNLDKIIEAVESELKVFGYSNLVNISVPQWRVWLNNKLNNYNERKNLEECCRILKVDFPSYIIKEANSILIS